MSEAAKSKNLVKNALSEAAKPEIKQPQLGLLETAVISMTAIVDVSWMCKLRLHDM